MTESEAARTPSGKSIYGRLLGYTARYRWVMLAGIAGVMLDALAQPAFIWLQKLLIDQVFAAKQMQYGYWIAGGILVVGLVRVVGNLLGVWGMEWVGRKVVCDLRGELFDAYLGRATRFFDRHSAGSLISRLTFNTEQIANAATSVIISALRDLLMIIGLLVVMFTSSWRLSLIVLGMVPVIALIVYLVSSRFRKISDRIQQAMGRVADVTEEAVNAHKVVKIFDGAAQEQQRFAEANEQARRYGMRMVLTRLLSSSVIQIIATLAIVVVVILAIQPSLLDEISPGTFTAVFTAMVASIPPLKRLTAVQEQIGKGIAAAQSLFEIMDLPAETDSGTVEIQRVEGQIAFHDLSFAYADSDQPILRNIDLIIPAGSVTALVGHSGSGKTTLVNLLPRFYPYQDGHILLDGRELAEYSLASLRQQIALVSQDVVLFNDTVAKNIAYGSLHTASEAAIRAAAAAANATEFIEDLPDGFQTPLGKSGVGLSGGQRQRIAIARALLKDAPILILDEATSALDSESEKAIQDALQQVMKGRTTLVITHRLSTAENADQVVVLEGGMVVEQGRHKELLANNGVYAALYRTQFAYATQ